MLCTPLPILAAAEFYMTNQLLIQYFHWYYNEDERLWIKVKDQANYLSTLGVTLAWLPPAFKSTEGNTSVGYDCYDLYDLGEFNQKNSVETKYGSKDEYVAAIEALRSHHIGAVADVIFNHKAGADELERVPVKRVDESNRHEFVSDVFEIDAWTKFTFPGRQGKYSEFIWDFHCFSGIDRAEDLNESGIFSIQNQYGEAWEEVPSKEMGNYDYLMFNDIETRNPAVRDELKRWGEWYYRTCGMDGFRLDAVKHVSTSFVNEWIDHMKGVFERDFFIVAENWVVGDASELQQYIADTEGRVQLFDSVLHHHLFLASRQGADYDLSQLFAGTLTQAHPELSVTFVDNHDSQPLEALESYVDFWFRPLAYALILLREQGIPCLFYPDLYGCKYQQEEMDVQIELVAVPQLPRLCEIRRDRSYGFQRDYLDHPNCIGWTREGADDKENSGLAVVMSNGESGNKHMEIGARHAGKTFIDALGGITEEIVIDENGWAEFYCPAGAVSVWILK